MKVYGIITTIATGWQMPEQPENRRHVRRVNIFVRAKSRAAAVRAFNDAGAHITMHYFNGYGGENGSPDVAAALDKYPDGTVLACWIDDYSREGLVKVGKD